MPRHEMMMLGFARLRTHERHFKFRRQIETLQITLLTSVLPEFEDVVRQMRGAGAAGAEAAGQMLTHVRLYLHGPPNKPTRDVSGLLPLVLRFLDRVVAEHRQCMRQSEPVSAGEEPKPMTTG